MLFGQLDRITHEHRDRQRPDAARHRTISRCNPSHIHRIHVANPGGAAARELLGQSQASRFRGIRDPAGPDVDYRRARRDEI